MSDERPKWKHAISQEDVLWLNGGVTKITHHWRFTSEDTSENWIELHREKDKRRFPSGFLDGNGYFKFHPDHRSLVQPTWNGHRATDDLKAITDWESRHKRERAEYERLKAKFGDKAAKEPDA